MRSRSGGLIFPRSVCAFLTCCYGSHAWTTDSRMQRRGGVAGYSFECEGESDDLRHPLYDAGLGEFLVALATPWAAAAPVVAATLWVPSIHGPRVALRRGAHRIVGDRVGLHRGHGSIRGSFRSKRRGRSTAGGRPLVVASLLCVCVCPSYLHLQRPCPQVLTCWISDSRLCGGLVPTGGGQTTRRRGPL